MNATQSTRSKHPDRAGVAFHPPMLLLLAIIIGFVARWIVELAFLSRSIAIAIGPMVTVVAFGLFFPTV